jgi:hypothetical protein
MDIRELSSFEKATAIFDLIIKALGWAGTVAVGGFSLWRYRQQRAKEARDYQDQKKSEMEQRDRELSQMREERQKELEQRAQQLKVKVFEKELDLYSRATSAASRLADAAKTGTANDAAEREFWELYWGPLCMVESTDVSDAMIDIGEALQRHASGQELQELSLRLALAARKGVEEKFNVQLGAPSSKHRR